MAKIVISLPGRFIKKVDRVAKAQRRTRSELIRKPLTSHLNGGSKRRTAWKKAFTPLRELEHQWVGQWDSTDIIRYYRDHRYAQQIIVLQSDGIVTSSRKNLALKR